MTEIDYSKKYNQYAKDVVDGKIVANRYIKLACQRHLDWFKRDDIYFDYEDVDRKIRFVSKMKHSTGKFNKMHFILYDWQQWIFANTFGWKWTDSHLRVTKKLLLFIARKNGKSSLSAALSLCMLLCDNEAGAEVACLANTGKQAYELFEKIKNYSETIDPNQKIFTRYRNSIKVPYTKSQVIVHSSDVKALDGYNCSCCVIDEFHMQKTWDLYNVMVSSMGMRTQPLMIIITTAGSLVGDYPLYSMWQTCKDILEGIKDDDTQFSALYQLDEEDDWKDEKNWPKCSPGYPEIVRPDYMRGEIKSAENMPSLEVGVLTKNLNKFCQSAETWIPHDDLILHTQKIDLNDFNKGGEEEYFCYVGVDLASVNDFSAVAFLLEKDDKVFIKTKLYIPEGAIERSINKDLYKKWINEGYLSTTSGKRANYEEILADIMKVNEHLPVLEVLYDNYNAELFTRMCEEEGYVMTRFSQTKGSFNAVTKEFERKLYNDEIVLDDNPVVRWCFGNAVLEEDKYENVKPVKGNGGANKIDAVIAILQALDGLIKFHQNNAGISFI